jgi:hypothetical protein
MHLEDVVPVVEGERTDLTADPMPALIRQIVDSA